MEREYFYTIIMQIVGTINRGHGHKSLIELPTRLIDEDPKHVAQNILQSCVLLYNSLKKPDYSTIVIPPDKFNQYLDPIFDQMLIDDPNYNDTLLNKLFNVHKEEELDVPDEYLEDPNAENEQNTPKAQQRSDADTSKEELDELASDENTKESELISKLQEKIKLLEEQARTAREKAEEVAKTTAALQAQLEAAHTGGQASDEAIAELRAELATAKQEATTAQQALTEQLAELAKERDAEKQALQEQFDAALANGDEASNEAIAGLRAELATAKEEAATAQEALTKQLAEQAQTAAESKQGLIDGTPKAKEEIEEDLTPAQDLENFKRRIEAIRAKAATGSPLSQEDLQELISLIKSIGQKAASLDEASPEREQLNALAKELSALFAAAQLRGNALPAGDARRTGLDEVATLLSGLGNMVNADGAGEPPLSAQEKWHKAGKKVALLFRAIKAFKGTPEKTKASQHHLQQMKNDLKQATQPISLDLILEKLKELSLILTNSENLPLGNASKQELEEIMESIFGRTGDFFKKFNPQKNIDDFLTIIKIYNLINDNEHLSQNHQAVSTIHSNIVSKLDYIFEEAKFFKKNTKKYVAMNQLNGELAIKLDELSKETQPHQDLKLKSSSQAENKKSSDYNSKLYNITEELRPKLFEVNKYQKILRKFKKFELQYIAMNQENGRLSMQIDDLNGRKFKNI